MEILIIFIILAIAVSIPIQHTTKQQVYSVQNKQTAEDRAKQEAISDMAKEDLPTMLLNHENYFKEINNLTF